MGDLYSAQIHKIYMLGIKNESGVNVKLKTVEEPYPTCFFAI